MKRNGCLRKGCLVSLVVPLVLALVCFFSFRSSRNLPDRFVLAVPVSGALEERAGDDSPWPFFAADNNVSFQELLFLFDHASRDKRIRTVLLDIGDVQASPAKIVELRQAIEKLRAGGRKVIAWLHSAEDADYHLAAACDSVVVERGGYLLLDGLKAETLLYTGALEKIGVSFQAAQWKQYKSGVEPFIRKDGSPEYREQVGQLLDEVYGEYTGYVSKRRGISRDSLESVINRIALVQAGQAVRLGLADGVASMWELKRSLARRIAGKALEDAGDLFVSAGEYRNAVDWPVKSSTREAIAVVTLSGHMVRSAGGSEAVMEDQADVAMVSSSLEAALKEDNVRAIVMRIDSPGGDALATADMLQMLDSAAARKPLVVSMSGVAASGGYMAALAGRTVYAQPLTITGSIGVYALKPDISGLAAKTGLGREVVTRGRFADANTPFRPLDDEAYRKFVDASGAVYLDFIGKVARSRKMTLAAVDSVAGGRVWTGRQAREQGLVDREGGLFDAVRAAAKLGGIRQSEQPRILLYPEQKTWLQLLLSGNLSEITGSMQRMLRASVLRELVPPSTYGAVSRMHEAILQSDKLRILAAMPGDILIR